MLWNPSLLDAAKHHDHQQSNASHFALPCRQINVYWCTAYYCSDGNLAELVKLKLTNPASIDKLMDAHKKGAIVFQTLDILPQSVCSDHSIDLSWRPPNKNAERIEGYTVSMVNSSGLVRPVYHGTATSCQAASLAAGAEYVFSVRAQYTDGSYVRSQPQCFSTKVFWRWVEALKK